ncbi:T-cell immunoglobulin and mucin domain-containing protein 4-like [Molossus molossus]|uniref:T-cell immunoglobulin and mucin domain-containing protein 4-like n=1 Tax=Molossus molossus TaxID=27622 RepID=UPI001746A1DF|nr:T-cell immunoglobulin and mucin domain-containing protein 4-like [Molossus molossus]KAF6482383.1 T cell immunoglobulin and mucin domain containing 4 [Molossus molossus]
MSKGPLILWLLTELCRLYLTPAAAETIVTAFLGQPVTLPCMYPSWTLSNSMCWGKGPCPNSKCNEELLHTDGSRVLSRKSPKYQLQGTIWRGEVSLTIFNTNVGDSTVYCCRIEVPGWFNDVKKNIRLKLEKAPTTTRRTTTRRTTTTTTAMTTTAVLPTTAMTSPLTTTTAVLPTTAMTTPDVTTRTPPQMRTTTALTTTATCPLPTPSFLPEATTILPTTEPSIEGSTLTAESETFLLSEVTSRDTVLLTSKASKTAVLGQHEVEPEQVSQVDSSFLAKVIASSLGLVLCASIAAFLLRGKVMKTNCFQKHTRLDNAGDRKGVLDDIQHGREDEDGLFTL